MITEQLQFQALEGKLQLQHYGATYNNFILFSVSSIEMQNWQLIQGWNPPALSEHSWERLQLPCSAEEAGIENK